MKLLSGKKESISAKTNLHVLIPGLAEKLGDNKIAIRQLAQDSLRALAGYLRLGVLLATLVPYLSSPNWHTREEILLAIIGLFVRAAARRAAPESNVNVNVKATGDGDGDGTLEDVDYAPLVNGIARLLDDEKPKVVQYVYEAVATVAHLGDRIRVQELLLELVDQEVYRKLCDRIEAGAIPVLGQDGLEFPYLTSGLSTQNSFYANTHGAFRSSTNSMLTLMKSTDDAPKEVPTRFHVPRVRRRSASLPRGPSSSASLSTTNLPPIPRFPYHS